VTPVKGGAEATCRTPCQLSLAPGEYQLAMANPDMGKPLADHFTVPAGEALEVRRNLPDFDLDRAVSSIVR
jgi:hypothetical protein